MIDTNDINLAKKLIKQESSPKIIKAQSPEFNRKMIEYGQFDVILNIENLDYNNSLRSIESGLNEYLAKTASKNKISIGIDLESLRNKGKKDKAMLINKIRQNIKICRKAKTRISLFNYLDAKNAFSLLISWGASTQQAKEAIAF